jgi:hypothetical protein
MRPDYNRRSSQDGRATSRLRRSSATPQIPRQERSLARMGMLVPSRPRHDEGVAGLTAAQISPKLSGGLVEVLGDGFVWEERPA